MSFMSGNDSPDQAHPTATHTDPPLRPTAERATRTVRFWLIPVVVVSVLMSILATLYIGGIVDPKKSLHDFPVAIVNNDFGETTTAGDTTNYGNQIRDALVSGIDAEKVDLQEMGIARAQQELDNGTIFGAVVIPSDFTTRLNILGAAGVVAGDVDKPVITVYTNPRAGSLGSSLVTSITDQALGEANSTVGNTLLTAVSEQAGADALSGAARLTLAEPIQLITTAHNPLPDGTALGLSAFYYALLLLLAGFTGATVVSALVDSSLGFTPTEFGPFFKHGTPTEITRVHTLLIKWAIMAVVGLVVSGLYLLIATSLGMPAPHSLALWMYGALAITAVGVTAVSIVSVFGTAGLLINLLLFVILGLPSAGATIPLAAAPRFFGWLAEFEPIHQVYLAVRAITYFDGRYDAGLSGALPKTFAGLAIGIAFGLLLTWWYDRKGFERRNTDLHR